MNSWKREPSTIAGDDLARVELVPEVLGHEPVQVGGVELRRLRGRELPGAREWGIEMTDDLAADRERVLVRGRVVVCDSRAPGVDVGAAELLGRDVLPRRGLHQRRAADEDRPGSANDHRLVRHRGHVRASGGAGAHDRRDLRDPERGKASLVEEDAPEVVAIGEDLGLEREERAARVDEVEAGEPVLSRDLLSAEMLLHRQRVVGAALDRRVVGDDDALAALDDPDPRDDARRRRVSAIELPGRERVQLEEGASRNRPAGRCARAR